MSYEAVIIGICEVSETLRHADGSLLKLMVCQICMLAQVKISHCRENQVFTVVYVHVVFFNMP